MALQIHYGPYESHGIIRHKTKRLRGIMEKLSELGYEIEIVPSMHINRLCVTMMGVEIFRCNIEYLFFNMEVDNNVVALKLISAVEEAKLRIYNPLNIPEFPIINPIKQRHSSVTPCTLSGTKNQITAAELLYEHPKVMSPFIPFQEKNFWNPELNQVPEDTEGESNKELSNTLSDKSSGLTSALRSNFRESTAK